MALQAFNEQFLPQDSNYTIKPTEGLPGDPARFVRNPYLENNLIEFEKNRPEEFALFRAGFLGTRVHYGEYNKGTKEEPRIVPQVKADTAERTIYQVLNFVLPELGQRAYAHTIVNDTVQYTMTKSGSEVGPLLAEYEMANRSIEEEANKTGELTPEYWALLGGMVAAGRGGFSLVRPTVESDPQGDISVQFDIKKDDVLLKLLERYAPKQWQRPDREGTVRIEFLGREAFDFIVNIHSACSVLSDIHPQIMLMLAYATDENYTPRGLYDAYLELK